MKKKILHIINYMGSGGVERFLIDFCKEIDFNKYDIEILVASKQQSIYSSKNFPSCVKVTILDNNKIYSIKCIRQIYKFLNENKYDIVHTHLFPVQMYIPFVNRNRSAKLVTTEHGISERRKKHKLFHFIEKYSFQKYINIVGVSEIVSLELKKEYTRYSDKIVTIDNGIDLNKFSNAQKMSINSLPIKKQDVIISMVGRMDVGKDQDTLIKAMNYLPNNFKLLLLGQGSREDELKKLVENLSLVNRVFFLGFRSDIEEIYKLADINVLSSYKEGLPLVVLESLAAGKAFLGSNVDGIKQLVPKNMLFEYQNEKMLSNMIEELIENNEKYELQKKQAKEILSKYDIKDMIKKYECIYDE